MKTDALHRVHIIHDLLASHMESERRILHKDIVEEVRHRLCSRVSAKTIQRDLATMREELGLPIEFDRRANTFRYTRQAVMKGLEVSAISNLDVRALLAGSRAMSLFRGTPWHDGLRIIFERLLSACPSKTVETWRDLFSRIRFEGPLPRAVDAALWTQVLQALDEERTMEITYRTGRDGVERTRKIDPYGLVIVEQQWQLIGWDHRTRAVRTFLLQRMTQWRVLEDFFRVRDGFTLDGYLQNAVAGQQSTGEAVRVRLRFTKEGTVAGEAAVWHPEERRSYDEQGRLVVEFMTAALYKVEREVLAWGGRCEVMEPKVLRERILSASSMVVAIHKIFVDGVPSVD